MEFNPNNDYLQVGQNNPETMYTYHASITRGVLINQVILLERLMDSYICEYFCHSYDKAGELMDTIMSTKRVTFDAKSQVFRTILDKVYRSRKKENTKLAADFKFIGEERNKLAHYFLDISKEAVDRFKDEKNSSFTLLKFEKIRSPEIFDFTRIKLIGDTLENYSDYLVKILEEQRVRNKTLHKHK